MKSNISNYKFTSFVEIVPLCREDLVYLPKSLAKQMSSMSRLALVKNIGPVVQMVDPYSGQQGMLNGTSFWRNQFRPLISAARSRLTRYVVLDNTPASFKDGNAAKKTTRRQRNRLSTLTLMREQDMGKTDQQQVVCSHIGYLCKAGDVVLGYNLQDTNIVDDEAREDLDAGSDTQLVIVRKLYGGVARGELDAAKQRLWRLERLDVEISDDMRKGSKRKDGQELDDNDEEDFLRELEADRDMRSRVNLYKRDPNNIAGSNQQQNDNPDDILQDFDDDDDEHDDQKVELDELLDGLVLDGGPDHEMEDPEEDQFDPDQGPMEGFASQAEMDGSRAREEGVGFIGKDKTVPDKSEAISVEQFGQQFMNAKFSFS